MTLNLKLSVSLLALAGIVAACGSTDLLQGIASLGSAFQSMFAAGPNTQPVNAQSVALSVNATAQPFNP